MANKIGLAEWQEKVGYLPPLIDLLSHDLYLEGRAPANAVAEALRTLRPVAKRGRTQSGSRVPYRTQHAVQQALAEYAVEACERTERPLRDAALEQALVEILEADTSSKAYPDLPNKPGKSNWVEKAGGLPSYIERVAKHLFYEKGYTESRAIATAVNWVKKTCATGRTFGGKTQVGAKARAQACNAVKQWEAKKAKSRAKSAVEAHGSAGLVKAVERLSFRVEPIPDQRQFATRYANRLTRIEGVLGALRERYPLAVAEAAKLLEADEALPVEDLLVRLVEYKQQTMILMEALGYGPKPVRARTDEKHKGRFHGMHGTERAVRKRDLIPSEEPEPLLLPEREEVKPPEVLIQEAAPTLAPSGTFDPAKHPRAQAGRFGETGGTAATGGGANLADAIRVADPQFRERALKPAAAAQPSLRQQAELTEQQVQAIGYADSPQGIAQFQKDYDVPVTGKLDENTISTIQSVYRQNVSRVLSKIADFTGIKAAGAGAVSKGKLNEAYEGTFDMRRIWTGLNHANASPGEGGERQPGGDDFDFDEPGTVPPGLREHEGTFACKTCVHFSPKGFTHHHGVRSGCMKFTWPVDKFDVCDDWLTLTPADTQLRVQTDRLNEAMQANDVDEIVAARAALKVLRERFGTSVPLPHPADKDLAAALVEFGGWTAQAQEAVLTAKGRKRIAPGNFAIPPDRYPIHDLAHARNALARVAQHGTPEEQKKVRAAVYRKYPQLKKRVEEAVLTAKKRKSLPSSAFAIPPDKYPIHDEAHARNALSRVAQHGTPEEQKKVRAAVKRRYPHIGSD